MSEANQGRQVLPVCWPGRGSRSFYAAGGGKAGSVSVNVLPSPGTLKAVRSPPHAACEIAADGQPEPGALDRFAQRAAEKTRVAHGARKIR